MIPSRDGARFHLCLSLGNQSDINPYHHRAVCHYLGEVHNSDPKWWLRDEDNSEEDVIILRIWRMLCTPHICLIHFGRFVWRALWNNDVKGPILKSFEAVNTRRFNFTSLSKFLIHSCQFNFDTVNAHLRYRRTQKKSHLVCTIFLAHQNPS